VLALGAPTGVPAKPPQVEARAWTLIDARTGDVLASHAAARKLPVASTTKLMTAYVALRELPLDRVVRAAPYEAEYGESLLGLRAGQRISVRDLLYGLILRSGNDTAYGLARAAAGSEELFVKQMNEYAAALGLSDTHYANPIGLDQRGNHSSARDLATLTQRLLAVPAFARIVAAREAVLLSVRPRRRIETINELLRMVPWATGVKTGHTFGAGYVLVGSGRRKGVSLISVAIGAPSDEDRYRDNLELLEHGFSLYRRRVPVRAGQALARPTVRYADDELPLRAERTVAVGLRAGERLEVTVKAPSEVEGPIRRGARLGVARVSVDGQRVATVGLRAGRAVPEASTLDVLRGFVAGNAGWLVLALSAILVSAAFLSRRRFR
jgi:serine-type D-Ala-D-Ala carboxypeptidase (penicillin-binding protein 5/6)